MLHSFEQLPLASASCSAGLDAWLLGAEGGPPARMRQTLSSIQHYVLLQLHCSSSSRASGIT